MSNPTGKHAEFAELLISQTLQVMIKNNVSFTEDAFSKALLTECTRFEQTLREENTAKQYKKEIESAFSDGDMITYVEAEYRGHEKRLKLLENISKSVKDNEAPLRAIEEIKAYLSIEEKETSDESIEYFINQAISEGYLPASHEKIQDVLDCISQDDYQETNHKGWGR